MGMIVGVLMLIGTVPAEASVSYKDGDKYVKFGGRIQLQYHQADPDGGETTDDMFFRRLRPYIEGSIHKDWLGKFQWDMGKAEGENEISVKDAYFQYKGIKNLKVTIGNANFPFSRELLTSSKKQQLVERTFVGDHNYGTPDRQLGVHLTGSAMEKKLTWGASVAMASIDPSTSKLDFDSPVNRNSDFVDGLMVGGRIDFHPLGNLKMAQGDFKRETKATIGVAAFSWSNDEDTYGGATPTADDVDSVTGFEVSGAFRGAGFSVDAEYNLFQAEVFDNTFTGGLYQNGETDLENYAVEAGYMVIPEKLEVVLGYEAQDADSYADEWIRTSFGANYFFSKHDIKVQTTYRMGESLKGVEGNDEDELFVQAQYVF